MKKEINVTVFCSASELEDKYTKPAETLASLIAQNGMNFVWGGSDSGLMKRTSDAAQNAGGKTIGISVEFLKHKAKQNADEMVITATLPKRKEQLLSRADAVVIMVGGIGTLDEGTEVIEHKKHGHHDKPIIFFNTDGFYDGLEIQMEKMHAEGFLPRNLDELVYFTDSPEDVINYIKNSLQT